MVENALNTWLKDKPLSMEQWVLAELLLALAKDFDTKTNTSTAAELRKTFIELKRSLGDAGEHDPLESLLKRG
jgi:hypothetical protein